MNTRFKPSATLILGTISLLLLIILWYYPTQPQAQSLEKRTVPAAANMVLIQSEIDGKITKILVQNNQLVQKGESLVQLDPIPYQIALTHAKAKLSHARHRSKASALQYREAKARLAQRDSELRHHEAVWKRRETLSKKGYVTHEQLAELDAKFQTAKAAQSIAQAQYEEAELLSKNHEKDPELIQAEAELAQAELNLKRTNIVAPTTGTIIDLSLYPEQVIAGHQPLFYLKAKQSPAKDLSAL